MLNIEDMCFDRFGLRTDKGHHHFGFALVEIQFHSKLLKGLEDGGDGGDGGEGGDGGDGGGDLDEDVGGEEGDPLAQRGRVRVRASDAHHPQQAERHRAAQRQASRASRARLR